MKIQYGGEFKETVKKEGSDSKLVQHGGEWAEDIKTGKDRSPVKSRHIDEYPGMDGPANKL